MGGKKRKQAIPEVIYRFDDQGTATFISDAVRRYGHTAGIMFFPKSSIEPVGPPGSGSRD